MKYFIISITLLASINLFANNDYKTWANDHGIQFVYIKGLKKDLFQTYTIKKSRGPKWGKDADFIADIVNEDFYERHTYWSESGYPSKEDCPNFSKNDYDNASEAGYGLSWKSIKRIKGSKKTVFYIASYTITIETNNKSCTYIQNNDNYIFLNKLKNGKPLYLGYLTSRPTKED